MCKGLLLFVLSSGPVHQMVDRDTFAAIYSPLVQLKEHTPAGKPLNAYWTFCDELFLSEEALRIHRSLGIMD